MRDWKDRLGIFASVACAIHCAATPLLVAALPTLKFTEWMIDPKFHQVIAIVCSALVALAIWPAFARFRDYRVLSLSSAGLGLILSAAFLMPDSCCSVPAAGPTNTAEIDHSHEGHSHAHAGHAHASTPSDASGRPQLAMAGVGMVQPWMTPIGGVLLILAHALNLRRRMVCTQRCCGGNADSGMESELLSMHPEISELSPSLARAS